MHRVVMSIQSYLPWANPVTFGSFCLSGDSYTGSESARARRLLNIQTADELFDENLMYLVRLSRWLPY